MRLFLDKKTVLIRPYIFESIYYFSPNERVTIFQEVNLVSFKE